MRVSTFWDRQSQDMLGVVCEMNSTLCPCDCTDEESEVSLFVFPCDPQDQFAEYMFMQAIKQDYKVLTENKAKFLLIHSSSGFKHSLKGETAAW